MKNINSQPLLRTDDYSLLIAYLHGSYGKTAFDRNNAEDLHAELQRAMLVAKPDFPADVVRLNSRVIIQADDQQQVLELMVVTPDQADIRQRKISVMAPVGTALIGFRRGHRISWKVPAGSRTFTILDVFNEP